MLCYTFITGVRIIGLTILLAGLMAGIGTLASLRTPVVRSVQQVLMFCSIPLFIVPAFTLAHLPDTWQATISRWMNPGDPNAAWMTILLCACILLFTLGLYLLALMRFKRSKLLLI